MKSSKYCNERETIVNVSKIIKEIEEQKKWFMDWDIDIDLERVLKKKEWGSSY